eukprot:Skav228567  [mRNA]  locus=scaffold5133:47486:49099:- [translate_table: standard]
MYDPNFDWDEAEQLMESHLQNAADGEVQQALVPRCKRLSHWQAHEAQVNQIRMSRKGDAVYTGCWDSASLCFWRSSDFLNAPPRRPCLELQVGGFLNDLAEISEHQVLVAVSAGLIPTPGESLKLYDLRHRLESGVSGRADEVTRFPFHTRGCRALSSTGLVSPLIASISKDALAVCRCRQGAGRVDLEKQHVVPNPHSLQEVTSLCWAEGEGLYSGGTNGLVKAWQVEIGKALWSRSVAAGAWVRKMMTLDSGDGSGCLVVCHSEGVTWMDPRQPSCIGNVEGQGQAHGAVYWEGAQRLVLALGRRLVSLDLRRGSLEPLADLPASWVSLEVHSDSPGQINLLAGLKTGVVETWNLSTAFEANPGASDLHRSVTKTGRLWPEQVREELQKEPEPSTSKTYESSRVNRQMASKRTSKLGHSDGLK